MKNELINEKQVREFAKHCMAKRAHPFTRVGSCFVAQVNAKTRANIEQLVKQQPSMGRTVKAI